MADAWRALHLEARRVQPASHPTGTGKGAEGGPRRRESRQFGEQLGAPHFGVFRRGETVEEPSVDLSIQLRQLLQSIADQQRQGHPPVRQGHALEPLVNRDVLPKQLISLDLEFGPQGQGPAQVLGAQGKLLDTDKMQPRPRRRASLEQLPGAEEIQPGAKPGLTDDQPPTLGQRGETLGQVVLLQEHVAGFFQARLVGEIHIVKHPGTRATLVIPVELGVVLNGRHDGLGENEGAILADRQGVA